MQSCHHLVERTALLNYVIVTYGRIADATGADTLENAKNSSARLNWAATSLYYSIVHSARLVIFLVYGDFPTSHAKLPKCFDGTALVTTNWLSRFLGEAGLPSDKRTGAEVNSEQMVLFWTRMEMADSVRALQKIATALRCSKELRNENNYESLLIAHEYRHTGLTGLFARLATAMRTLANKTASIGAHCFATYMTTRTAGEQTFIVRYCRKRILEPIREWHSEAAQREVQTILGDMLRLNTTDEAGADQIDVVTSRTYFNEKDGLLSDFQSKIIALERSVT
jgi:hypothetical protein